MKAHIKATGEIFEVASYATIPMECCDSFGEPLRFCLDDVEILSEGNDLKESEVPDYWTRLEHQYAGMAMNALLSSDTMMEVLSRRDNGTMEEEVAREAFDYAHALIQKLKEKEERK